MKIEERDYAYVQRMIEYCDKLEAAKERFGDSYDAYINDSDYRDVVCMNIFQIGELANQISDETQEKVGDIPWEKMYGIRNIIAHAYIQVDDRIMWETIKEDIPQLKKQLETL